MLVKTNVWARASHYELLLITARASTGRRQGAGSLHRRRHRNPELCWTQPDL